MRIHETPASSLMYYWPDSKKLSAIFFRRLLSLIVALLACQSHKAVAPSRLISAHRAVSVLCGRSSETSETRPRCCTRSVRNLYWWSSGTGTEENCQRSVHFLSHSDTEMVPMHPSFLAPTSVRILTAVISLAIYALCTQTCTGCDTTSYSEQRRGIRLKDAPDLRKLELFFPK